MLKAADQVKGQGKGEAAASFAEREDVAEGEQGGAAMGNLAAMAAASAAKRGKGKVERLDLGGLAAMAAAAAFLLCSSTGTCITAAFALDRPDRCCSLTTSTSAWPQQNDIA